MQYDTLAGIVERHFPEMKPLVDEARIFRLEKRQPSDPAHQGIDICDWEPETKVTENFRLPFNVIAIEEAGTRTTRGSGCVIFQNFGDPAERIFKYLISWADTIATGLLHAFPGDGISSKLQYANVLKIDTMRMYDCRESEPLAMQADILALEKKAWKFYEEQRHEVVDMANTPNQSFNQFRDYVEDRFGGVAGLSADIDRMYTQTAYLGLLAGVVSVLCINEPAKFIVEESPLKSPPRQHGRIQRSQHRPHYIVLTPGEIRKRLILPDPEHSGTKKAPHERRGHWRKLQAERYIHKKGSVQWIKPCWIGPSEAVVGKNKYIVKMDL